MRPTRAELRRRIRRQERFSRFAVRVAAVLTAACIAALWLLVAMTLLEIYGVVR